ncbi:hypothetical protein [Okeania sp. SIO2B9]|uniref:hypothetical protein n=1 Tax=Okeania sp. SIO2B9 TaxID=2607782 RepID=UPI00257D7518|nr:hypothetical protein [Okeania sp. SIO2B9]
MFALAYYIWQDFASNVMDVLGKFHGMKHLYSIRIISYRITQESGERKQKGSRKEGKIWGYSGILCVH